MARYTSPMFENMPNLSVRLVQPEDEPYIFELFASVRGEGLAEAGMTAEQRQQFLDFQYKAMHNTYADNYPEGIHNVILRKKKPIGRIYTNETDTEIRILDVIIHPKKRNHGFGSEIMQAMIAECDRTNKILRFYVWTNNAAGQRFYKRHGCEFIRDDGGYLLFEKQPTPTP